jgi:hypothetical protein
MVEEIRNGNATSERVQALVDLPCSENSETLFEVAKHMVPELREAKVLAQDLVWP